MAKTGRHMQGSGVGRKKAAESNTPIKVGKAATLWHRRESWKLDGGKRRWKEFLFLSHIENCQSLAKGQLECELNCHMSHSTDFAKTTIQGYSEQRMRFLHLYQLWRCSTKFKTLHSFKATVYTIFRFSLSFQLWESAHNELSRPDGGGPLCPLITVSWNGRIHSHSGVWL